MTKLAATLQDLPNELVLEVVLHFSYIPHGRPLSTILMDQSERRLTNRESQLTLRSLCLTCRRLRKIAIPILYESFSEVTTWHGPEPLQLFLRTISSPKPGIGLQVRFVEYLQYVENISEDRMNRRSLRNLTFEERTRLTARYFQVLAEIVKCATCLRSLSIVSMESKEISFWRHILPTNLNSSTSNSFQKLQFLYFGGYGWEYNSTSGSILYAQICQAMTSLPMLMDIRATGIVSDRPMISLHGTFKHVQRLDFTACKLNFGQIVEVMAACNGLQHIACSWSILNLVNTSPSELHAALSRHKMSLRTLRLDMRYGAFNGAYHAYCSRIGSLKTFTALQSLCICETSLLGTVEPRASSLRWGPPPRISELLPINLEELTLLVADDYDMENDEPSSLRNLADDCKHYLPALKQISVDSYCSLSAPELTDAFENVGVRFWYTSL
jgi:ribosomal protein S7